MKDILSKVFCKQIAARYSSSLSQSPLLFKSNAEYSQADSICNRVLELYGFVRYPINTLWKLNQMIQGKRDQIQREVTETKQQLDSLVKAGSGNNLIKVDIQTVRNRLHELKRVIQRYSKENILRTWRNDMELRR